jgi:[ribosomal protein S5]-alanine N-acetyltransferase
MAGRANPASGATVINDTQFQPDWPAIETYTMTRSEEIGTARLWLRPPREADAQQIFARYAQDPEVCRYMSWTPHQSIEDTLTFLRRIVCDNAERRSKGFLIFSRESGELLGSIGGAIDQHRMQFGYCLARDAWSHGIATEAARAFVTSVFEIPTIGRIQAYCDVENRASARVLEKAGLELEGTLRRLLVLPNLGDSPRDVYCYAKVRDGAYVKAG